MESCFDKNELFAFIDAHVDGLIQDTVELIQIPSVSSDRANIDIALEFVLDKSRKMGFIATSLMENRVGRVEMGDGDEVIGILTHLDVVDVEDDWTVPPYGGIIKDGMIWGRGALDEKAPVLASLYAMQAVQSLNIPLKKKVQMIIGTQEEVEWSDLYDYAKKYPVPDYGFTPDGEFPVTNIEKGYCDVMLSFSMLPTDGAVGYRITRMEAGQAPNSIPSRALAVIAGEVVGINTILEDFFKEYPDVRLDLDYSEGNTSLTARGLMVHSSVPEKGINAICLLCRFLDRLPLAAGGAASLVRMIADDFDGAIYGEKIGLYSSSEYLNGEYIHRNTIVPTVIDMCENDVRVMFNIRHSFGTDRGDIEKAYQLLCVKYGCSKNVFDTFEPLYVSREKPFIKIMTQAYEEISGLDGTPTFAVGTSYAKAMPNTVAWGPIFPGDEEFTHAADERISIDRLVMSTKIYALALAEMVFTEASLK